MINVWRFFLQTLSVSAVALVLLIIKRLFQDKISPNVQYALWLVLALRIVLPVGAGVHILIRQKICSGVSCGRCTGATRFCGMS